MTIISFLMLRLPKLFYEKGAGKLKLEVKAVDQNGFIKRVFVKVKNEN